MKEIIKKAEKYILDNGTELQKVCIDYLMGRADKEQLINELGKYQNSDGGWANGLEIEYQGPVSTPYTTAAAMAHIVKFGLEDSVLLERTIEYLRNTQYDNGKWDDTEEMAKYPHPPYMGPQIYTEYKTGMILKWLLRLNMGETEMAKRAQDYLASIFDEVSMRNDFWSAVGYTGAFSMLPGHPDYQKIMGWGMKILMPGDGNFGWQQVMGIIDDDMPIPEQYMKGTLDMISQCQEEDGGWPHPFGPYNRVWSAIFIVRFLSKIS